MSRNRWSIWGLGAIFGSGILSQGIAVEAQIAGNSLDTAVEHSLEQINSVQQLRDVSPGDWAYEALRSLVDRYGCISGFPNQTYRGDQSLSRYEFAAGLNSCLNQIERLIASQEGNSPDQATIEKLTQEFEQELIALSTQADNLESRTAILEDSQFSTTSKLKGRVVFSLTNAFGDDRAVPAGVVAGSAGEVEDELVFDNRVRLDVDTSFTGKDLLKIRLDSTNLTRFGPGVTGTNMTRLAFDRPLGGDVRIGKLFYRFRAGDKLRVTIDGTRANYNANVSDTFSNYFANPIKGSISNFGRFNPIYAQGIGGAGITAYYDFSDAITFNAGYLARNAENATSENGLFDGSFAALAQLDIQPTDALKFGFTYVRAYYPSGRAFVTAGTGSLLANAPFGNIDTAADHFGLQTSLGLSSAVEISGWVGYTIATAQTSGVGVNADDQAEILNWAVSLAFPDLGGAGNVGGIIVGQQPRVLDNDTGAEENDANWHLQAQYRYKLAKGISLNPGIIAILNPENNEDNDTIYIGTVRTIFEF